MLRRLYVVGGYVAAGLALIVFWLLRQRGLIAATPYWVLLIFLTISCTGDLIGRLLQRKWPESLHCDRVRMALAAFTSALVLYATGWGSMLIVGFAVGATQILGQSARRDWQWAYGCNVVAVALGEAAVHAGIAPSLIDPTLAHAVAAVGVLCLAVVLWILGEALETADEHQRLVVEREESLLKQATTDPLTGLPNRKVFNTQLEQALSRLGRSGGGVAILVIDLDGFKTVNDSLGHGAGDELLIAVAARLGLSLRSVDTIARLGGDEFAILVEDLDPHDRGTWAAQRLLDALDDPLHFSERSTSIGASIGIATTDRADANPVRLLSHADLAMYQAKREGRGCYRVFEDSMHTDAIERMDLEQDLRMALANGALTVHFQPVVETLSGAVTSLEALARWEHPERGFIRPDLFISVAEQSGLIIDLGRAVLDQSLLQIRGWNDAFPQMSLRIAINASRIQLANRGFAAEVIDALARAGVEPTSLTMEVTESVLSTDSEQVVENLEELRRIGVLVAIDDFGTGYSSLSILADLPIDILKVDKRFVDNVTRDAEGLGFVSAIMHLAETLDLDTVAEGVEEPEQHQILQELGCAHIQGYLHSRPLPADQATEFLARRSVSSLSAGD